MSHTTLTPADLAPIVATLADENRAFMRTYPGESDRRQAVHTVYGGAHLFKADSTGKLGEVALRDEREPDRHLRLHGDVIEARAPCIGVAARALRRQREPGRESLLCRWDWLRLLGLAARHQHCRL